jgi:glycosyltransferase involved in cell wall biosynthesis
MKIFFFANTDWYLYNFRRSLALALANEGHQVMMASPPGPFGPKLRQMGFVWHPAPMNRISLNPIRELALLFWLTRLLQKERPDIVHGFTIKCAVYASIAGRLSGVKGRVSAITGMGYVFTSNSLKARALRPVIRSLLRIALGGKGAKLIVQNTDDYATFVHQGLLPASNIHLIPSSGVDCVKFSPGTNCEENDRPFRVLLAARILFDKGAAEFAESSRLLKATGRRIEFLLAGTPDPGNPATVPLPTLMAWVQEGLVQWLGQVEDMAGLLRTVDLFVLPSYREGLPKGLIEAGASGCALITTDVPGCREVVTHGVNGLVVPARSAEKLATAIAELQDDSAMRKRFGCAARGKVLECYDEKIVITNTIAVYHDLTPTSAN